MINQDEKYMREAIKQAKKAYALGEVPIGCVIVYQDKIIGRGYNRRTIDKNTIAHAEMMAIKKASKKMKNFKSYSSTVFPETTRREKNSKSELTLNNVLKNKTMFSILTFPSRDPMILVRLTDVPSLLLQSVIIFFKHLSNFYYFFF